MKFCELWRDTGKFKMERERSSLTVPSGGQLDEQAAEQGDGDINSYSR